MGSAKACFRRWCRKLACGIPCRSPFFSLQSSAFILSLLCILFLSCTGPKAPPGKILVEFWDFPRLPAVSAWQLQAIKDYEAAHPNVHIELTRLSWGKGGERLDIAAFAGRAPDVSGAVLYPKYIDPGLLMPVDEWLDEPIPDLPGKTWRDDIHPAILRDVQWGGKTWAYPWYKEGFVILLNRDLFSERGVPLPPNGAWTWEEFLATMHKMTFDRDGDGKIDVYGFGFNTGPQKWEAYPFLFAEGMQILDPAGRRMLIDSDAARRGIGRLLAMEYEEKISLPGAGGIMDDVTWSAFSGRERRLAAVSQGLWAINSVNTQNERLEKLRAENPDAKDLPAPLRVSIALFPKMPGQPQCMTSYGVGSLMVFRRADNPERTREAAKFARYMTLEAGQQINKAAGNFPSRISTGNLFEGDERYENIWPHIADAATPPTHPAWPQLDLVVGDNLQLILLKKQTVEEGLAKMARDGQTILDDYWKSRDAAREGAP